MGSGGGFIGLGAGVGHGGDLLHNSVDSGSGHSLVLELVVMLVVSLVCMLAQQWLGATLVCAAISTVVVAICVGAPCGSVFICFAIHCLHSKVMW